MLSKISLKLEAKLEGIMALTPAFYLSQLKTGDKGQSSKIAVILLVPLSTTAIADYFCSGQFGRGPSKENSTLLTLRSSGM